MEHTGVFTQLFREAHEYRGGLDVLWLDLANAYGSIPHTVVELALHLHHIPSKIKDLILYYYNNFRMRVTFGSEASDWHRIGKGIITGCTISVILFALSINMVVKSADVECRGPLTKSGVRQPPIRACMHDLTVTTTSVPGCRWILQGLERLMTRASMGLEFTFDSTLRDSAAIQRSSTELGTWLAKVDKSGLPGRFKAWIYQHSILP